MSGYCDERAAVYDDSIRKARKEHRCCACRETIRVGDYYSLTTVIGDGTVDVWKRCPRCQAIHLHLRTLRDDYEEVWPDEQLDCGEEYTKHWNRPPPPEIAELAFVTRDEMQARVKAALETNR
jgi:hypothetical protein